MDPWTDKEFFAYVLQAHATAELGACHIECRVTQCSTRRATGRYHWTRGLRASASMRAYKGKGHSLRRRQV
jgi:hypothetical protein